MKMNSNTWKLTLGILICALAGAALTGKTARTADPNNITGTHGLILIDKVGSRVRFFDPKTYKEISNIDVGSKPHEFAISPDRTKAYVSVYGDGVYGHNAHPGHTIAIIDLASRQMVDSIDVSPYQAPHGIAVDTSGTIYVTCDLSRKLLTINPKTKSIEAAIDTEGTGHFLALLPDASKAYITNKNDKQFVSVIDVKARKLIARIPAPNGSEGIASSPDGKRILFMDQKSPILYVVDTATDTIIDKITLEGFPKDFRVRISPDGKEVLTVAADEPQANLLDASNLHGPQAILPVGKVPMGMAFAPDGRTALVANHGEGTVSVIDMKERKAVMKFPAGEGTETLAYY